VEEDSVDCIGSHICNAPIGFRRVPQEKKKLKVAFALLCTSTIWAGRLNEVVLAETLINQKHDLTRQMADTPDSARTACYKKIPAIGYGVEVRLYGADCALVSTVWNWVGFLLDLKKFSWGRSKQFIIIFHQPQQNRTLLSLGCLFLARQFSIFTVELNDHHGDIVRLRDIVGEANDLFSYSGNDLPNRFPLQ